MGLEHASQCSPCPAGFFCTDGAITGPCASGYFCKFGNYQPNPLPYHQSLLPWQERSGGACPNGYYCNGTKCKAIFFHEIVIVSTADPTPCPTNTSRIVSFGTQIQDCGPCPQGYSCLDGSLTVPCPVRNKIHTVKYLMLYMCSKVITALMRNCPFPALKALSTPHLGVVQLRVVSPVELESGAIAQALLMIQLLIVPWVPIALKVAQMQYLVQLEHIYPSRGPSKSNPVTHVRPITLVLREASCLSSAKEVFTVLLVQEI